MGLSTVQLDAHWNGAAKARMAFPGDVLWSTVADHDVLSMPMAGSSVRQVSPGSGRVMPVKQIGVLTAEIDGGTFSLKTLSFTVVVP